MLKYAEFDPLVEEPNLPPCPEDYTSPYGYYIVQMKTQMIQEWWDGIEDAGGIFYGYVPNNAYIVRMNHSVKDVVEELPFVRWIGIYHPLYKLSEELREIVEGGGSHQIITIDLIAFDNIDSVIAQIIALGGIIENVSDPYLRVTIEDTKLYDIALIPDVHWMQAKATFTHFNDIAVNNNLMNVRSTWSNPAYGLTGQDQIIAVMDSGIDTGVDNPTVNDDIHRDFDNRIVNIHDYVGDGADDNTGHGTHVAGSAVGNGARSNGNIRGVAYEANLVFQAIGRNDGSLSPFTAADLTSYFQDAYNENARIHTNSWGVPSTGQYFGPTGSRYELYSQSVDDFIWRNRDMVILFAVGNDGSDADEDGVVDNPSIGIPATAKNCISVGATENLRTNVYDSDADGQLDEDRSGDWNGDGWPGVRGDDDGDGLRDYNEYQPWILANTNFVNDDDEDGLIDEDPPGDMANNGLDDDNDGLFDGADPDLDGDPNPGNPDDDNDGVTDEDWAGDMGIDGWPGIPFVDDDGDGFIDYNEYQPWLLANTNFENDDDEDGAQDEDPIDGINNDGDGLTDEDPGPDINGDGWPGIGFVDDDFDGTLDYNDYQAWLAAVTNLDDDDDEDGLIDEDPPGDMANNGLDDDNDGLFDGADPDLDGDPNPGNPDDDNDGVTDEDWAGDMGIDGWPGVGFVDDDFDGTIDFNDYQAWLAAVTNLDEDDDEDGRLNEDTEDTYGSYWPNDFPGPASPINVDHMANNPQGMAAFSSRGNTADGRIKPDIVAPGTWILSTKTSQVTNVGWGRPSGGGYVATLDDYYAFMGGTSMAAPLTAGAAALVRQYYIDLQGIIPNANTPSAALIKATLINGATDIAGQYIPDETGTIPNIHEGWGRVDLTNSILPTTPRTMKHYDKTTGFSSALDPADEYYVTDCLSTEPLKITLVWTDPPADPSASGILVNDLDLRVTLEGSTDECYGNDFDAATGRSMWRSAGSNNYDRANNVEQVYIPNPSDKKYKIEVIANSIDTGNSPQPYALVISYGQDTKTINLYAEWNFISLPLEPDRPYIKEVLRSIHELYTAVQYYDASDGDWKHYNPSKPPHLNDLWYLYPYMGFYIYIPPDNIPPAGYLELELYGAHFSEDHDITLYSGWNDVGYPALRRCERDQALLPLQVGFDNDITIIYWYETPTDTWYTLESGQYFEVGRGYSMYFNHAQGTWSVNHDP